MPSADRLPAIRSDFTSQGVRCRGELLLPAGVERTLAVILTHGFAAEREFCLLGHMEIQAEFLAAHLERTDHD